MSNPFVLTRDNYFSPEAEALFLGSSSFKAWDKEHGATEVFGHTVAGGCEAREVAKRKGEWQDKEKLAFLVGNYIHTWSSSEEDFKNFCQENSSAIYKPKGGMYADFVKADKMIACLKDDPAIEKMREGKKEQIFVGKIFGVDFKIQVDILNVLECRFCDIKTTENISKTHYNPQTQERETFIQKFDYLLQFSIYAEILRQNYKQILEDALNIYTEKQLEKFIKLVKDNRYLDCYILAVDKQEIPDHEIIFMDLDGFIKEKLQEIEFKLPHIVAVRNGEIEPMRCERCEYCRSTKKITKPIHWLDLGSELR
ncbi:MAG: hypothetical protein K0Q53_155 [Massilibacillus sp.]|jgi:hypothetical protein|nr:hypothetical protein [Massilibacillus sp.]